MKKILSLVTICILVHISLHAAAGAYWLEDPNGFMIPVYGYFIFAQYTLPNLTNPSIDGFAEEKNTIDTWLKHYKLFNVITVRQTTIYNANKGAWALVAKSFNNECISACAFGKTMEEAIESAAKYLNETNCKEIPYSIVATGGFDVSTDGAKNIERHQWLIDSKASNFNE
jgi:hypothetical protein